MSKYARDGGRVSFSRRWYRIAALTTLKSDEPAISPSSASRIRSVIVSMSSSMDTISSCITPFTLTISLFSSDASTSRQQ